MDTDLTLKELISIKASVAVVWKALTNKEMIKKYFWGTEITCDWTKGSSISFKGEWEGTSYDDKGTILEIEQEKILKYNYWSSFWGEEPKDTKRSIITYEITQLTPEETVLSIHQIGFKDIASRDHSIQSWRAVLENIKKLLAA